MSAALARLGRIYPVIAGGVFGCLLLSGALLRLGLFRADNVLGISTHRHLFSAHAVLALAAIPLFLVHLTPAAKPDAGIRALVAAGYGMGAVLFAISTLQEERVAVTVGLAFLVMAAALAVFALRILGAQLRAPASGFLIFAAASNVFGWAEARAGQPHPLEAMLFPVVLAALVVPVARARSANESGAGPVFLGAASIHLFSRIAIRNWPSTAPLSIPGWIAAVVVCVGVFRASRLERTAFHRWLRRLEALLFVGGASLTALIQIVGDGFPLSDTLFVTAAGHLEAFVLMFALLRGLDGERVSRWGWSGFALAAVGAHLFGYGCMLLGRAGMPLGYAGYLENFAPLQRFTSLGAMTMVAGLLLVALAARGSAQDHSK